MRGFRHVFSSTDGSSERLTRRAKTLRLLGWLLIVSGGVWLFFWVGVPLTAPEPPDRCQPVDGVVRGVAHVHAVGHDWADRSAEVVEVAQEHCLDFVISTEHGGRGSGLTEIEEPSNGPLILDGAEWNDRGHHHSQLVGARDKDLGVDGNARSFRILNHPWASEVAGWDDLSSLEQTWLSQGLMGVEVLNSPRLARYPNSWLSVLLAGLAGPGRDDLVVNALMDATPDLTLWERWQTKLRRPIPHLCGTDAHGELLDYRLLFPSAVIHIAAPEGELTAQWVVDQLRAGNVLCVNEYMGSPGKLTFTQQGCELRMEVALPDDAEWRLVRDGETVDTGSASAIVSPGAGVYHLELWRRVSFGLLGSHWRMWALGRSHILSSRCESR